MLLLSSYHLQINAPVSLFLRVRLRTKSWLSSFLLLTVVKSELTRFHFWTHFATRAVYTPATQRAAWEREFMPIPAPHTMFYPQYRRYRGNTNEFSPITAVTSVTAVLLR